MGFRKISLHLKALFKEDSHKKNHIDVIRNLLYQLKDQEIKLKTQLKEIKNKKNIKELKKNLKIIYAQQKKGEKILEEGLHAKIKVKK
jgi:hypothetical protein